jgi:hypothetical protein
MSASLNKIAVVALILGLATAIARADSPPKLDVEPTCNAAAAYAIAVGRTKEACLADERAAESTLAEKWSTYSAADKTSCIVTVNVGGPPSYVELLSCIEVFRDACALDLAWLRPSTPSTWSSYMRTCDNGAKGGPAKVKKTEFVVRHARRLARRLRVVAGGARPSGAGHGVPAATNVSVAR